VAGASDQLGRIHFQSVGQASKHGHAHRRLRTFDLTYVAGAEANTIGEVFLCPPSRGPEPSNARRDRLLQIGHSASGRCRHDPSRNDASYSSKDSLPSNEKREVLGRSAVAVTSAAVLAFLRDWKNLATEKVTDFRGRQPGRNGDISELQYIERRPEAINPNVRDYSERNDPCRLYSWRSVLRPLSDCCRFVDGWKCVRVARQYSHWRNPGLHPASVSRQTLHRRSARQF
jgi:hypothetical protein